MITTSVAQDNGAKGGKIFRERQGGRGGTQLPISSRHVTSLDRHGRMVKKMDKDLDLVRWGVIRLKRIYNC
jgi:hypothetical protein